MRITRLSGGTPYARLAALRLNVPVLVIAFASVGSLACNRLPADRGTGSTAAERLRPVANRAESGVVRRTVYVPIYASLYLGRDITPSVTQLTSTLSVRNVSPLYPLVIESVRYYDSHGRPVKDHLPKPAELAALASVEFVVEADAAAGAGANFLVRWSGPAAVDEPLIEAVMVGRSANAGLAFASVGRVVTNEPQ